MGKLPFVLLSALFLMVVSCSTAGRQFDSEMIKQNIKLGKSNKEDVLRICGEPLTKNSNIKEGTEIWHYAYVDKKMTGTGVLAHVAGVGSEWKSETTVMDVFLKDGIVVDLKLESSSSTKMSFSPQ